MNNDNGPTPSPTLPDYARLPINRCNLPAQILGGLTFQQHPVALHIDGVEVLHKWLFQLLGRLPDKLQRAERFMDYMVLQFRLHKLEDAGLMGSEGRGKADYLRLLRGWLFNPDGREAAVLKGWVESRFGLLARYHHGPLHDPDSDTYRAYLAERSAGLYGTNALEAQLDLLYSYSQFELATTHAPEQRLRLYRGVNRLDDFEMLEKGADGHSILLLNNLSAFSSSRERAEEFGDYVMEAEVPWQKVLFYSRLLPNHHIGEEEYLVIGGVYRVKTCLW